MPVRLITPSERAERILFDGIVDYAGLYPPAALTMAAAVRNYAHYRVGSTGWMLGRFVCPCAALAQFSTDAESAEQQYLRVPASNLSPEQLFEQQWATTLLAQTLDRLREEFVAAGKGAMFAELKIFLTGEKRIASYAELAAKLGTTEAALKMAVSRMRQRYGELLRAEIADTVSGPEEVEEELRALFAALSS